MLASILFREASYQNTIVQCSLKTYKIFPFHSFFITFILVFFFPIFHFQNLLISDQSSVIIKSLSKLPKSFDIVVYPTLVTIICDNDGAKNVIGKEFDIKVRELF